MAKDDYMRGWENGALACANRLRRYAEMRSPLGGSGGGANSWDVLADLMVEISNQPDNGDYPVPENQE